MEQGVAEDRIGETGEDYVFEKGRIEALTDGIFAVTMTLLMLELKLPDLRTGDSPVTWDAILGYLDPKLESYVVSFVVLCVFWLSHIRLMRLVRRVDHPFLWMSLLYLLATTFVPFSTSLIESPYRLQIVALIYGANVGAILAVLFLLWHYVLDRPHLLSTEISPALARLVRLRFALALAVVLFAFVLSFWYPRASTTAFALLLLGGLLRPRGPKRAANVPS
jgi:uncharacterized membrane protein